MTGPVPASPLDVFQLYLGDAEHAFLLSLEIVFSGFVDGDRLRSAVRRMTEDVPILSCCYAGDLSGGYWVSRCGPLVRETTEPPETVRSCFFSCGDVPFRVTVCRGLSSDTLVLCAAHLLTDARGLLELAVLLGEYYRSPGCRAGIRVPHPMSRGLGAALSRFSRTELAELAARDARLFPEFFSVAGMFCLREPCSDRHTVLRRTIPAAEFSGIRAFAKRCEATLNDLFTAAYGTALWEYAGRTAGIRLPGVPLCSAADLRRYFPVGLRSAVMNYSVPYWSPVPVADRFSETLCRVRDMACDRKSHALGIGAAVPYAGDVFSVSAASAFSGVPFLTNLGLLPDLTFAFGPELCVRSVDFSDHIFGSTAISAAVYTWNRSICFTLSTGSDAEPAAAVLDLTVDILRGCGAEMRDPHALGKN